MRLGPHFIAALLSGPLCIAACHRSTGEVLEIGAEPGDLVVSAIARGGAIIDASLSQDTPEIPFTASAGDAVVSWAIKPGSLISPDGSPIGDDMLAGLRVHVIGEEGEDLNEERIQMFHKFFPSLSGSQTFTLKGETDSGGGDINHRIAPVVVDGELPLAGLSMNGIA